MSATARGAWARAGAAALTGMLVTTATTTPLAAQALTLDEVVASGAITGSIPGNIAWAPDSRRLAFLWDSGGGQRQLWTVQPDGRGRRALGPFVLAGAEGAPREFAWTTDGQGLLVLQGAHLLHVDARTGVTRSIARPGVQAHELVPSPDGRRVALLRDGDIWLVSLTGDTTLRRLTTVGLPSISSIPLGTYARADREIGPATWASGAPSMAWSPDGRFLAAHLVSREQVRRVPFPYYLGLETVANELRRSYPGDENEHRSVVVLWVERGDMRPVGPDVGTTAQVLSFAWSSRGTLLIDRELDDATDRWIEVAAVSDSVPATRVATRDVRHFPRSTRIYTEHGSAWAADGRRLLLTTDTEDRHRVMVLDPGTGTLVPVTPATSDVQGAAFALPDGGLAWIAGAPTPAERHLFRASPGGAAVQVTRRPGTHRVVISPDGRHVASVVSDDTTPPHLLLLPMRGGAEQVVTAPGGPRRATLAMVAPRYVQFPGAAPGETLHAKVWLPASAQRGERVPVIFGPVYSNTVRNRWGGTYGLLQQLLVQRGYAVLQVDVRGSTGYGRAFREAFLFEWGGRDLDDLTAAKQWLGAQAWADTARTGIFGSSYGGLITVYALFRRPGLFKVGVAGAAAVDPHFFGSDDVAITRRPATHPDAFRRGALQYAGGLQDHLMLIHGLMDDVVPFKTIADLAEELMRQRKDFDLVVAPGATHAWTARPAHGRYLLGKLVQHFERHLPTR